MELISREATIKSLCDYHKGKKTIGQCIDDVPTIQAVPIEVLQEIRQKISDIQTVGYKDAHTMFIRTNDQVKHIALDIIDTHISALRGKDK